MSLDSLTKEELLKLSKEDREALIKDKAAKVKYTDSLAYNVGKPTKEAKGKAAEPSKSVDKDTLDVKIVCNTAWLCDSHMDVLTSDCYANSVAAKGANIPHIADHKQSSVAHVGDVTKVYTTKLDAKDLGFEGSATTTALIMESTVRKDYNEDVFKFYKNGKINQHSIGLRYLDIKLALDSKQEDDEKEKAAWDEAYPKILNKELVDKRGYFWLVKEIDIIENSCVLFGANSLTPTLEVKSDTLATKTTPKLTKVGTTMTLEEALAKAAELSAELATVKANQETLGAKGASGEQTRILAILESAKTLAMDSELAIKQIKSGATSEAALGLFEAVAEAVQKANPVKTEAGLTPSINPEVLAPTGEKSFMEGLDAELAKPSTGDAVKWEVA